jgi:3-deoxy-manno-octulosonate cytidylyltransferase (CMP-KDO synthetase)
VVKLVLDARGRALYFSRLPIPHGARPDQALVHQGVYGWRRDALLAFAAAPPCEAERLERLEQLRALHLGMRLGVVLTAHASLGIDTPADYAAFVKRCVARAAARGVGSP